MFFSEAFCSGRPKLCHETDILEAQRIYPLFGTWTYVIYPDLGKYGEQSLINR